MTLGGAEKGVSALAQNLTNTTMDSDRMRIKDHLSAPWDLRAASFTY